MEHSVRVNQNAPSRAELRRISQVAVAGIGGAVSVLNANLTISLPWFVWAYLSMSVLTFIVYAVDKSRAGRGGRRVRESTLHALELAWGWPGALIAQAVVRHKRRKTSFMVIFWMIVAMHILVWLWRWQWIRFW